MDAACSYFFFSEAGRTLSRLANTKKQSFIIQCLDCLQDVFSNSFEYIQLAIPKQGTTLHWQSLCTQNTRRSLAQSKDQGSADFLSKNNPQTPSLAYRRLVFMRVPALSLPRMTLFSMSIVTHQRAASPWQ